MIKTIFTIIALFFIGCNGGGTAQTNITTPKTNFIPEWILNPNSPNQICAVGSANLNDKDYQKIALLKAKSNISKEINIYINSSLIRSEYYTNKEYKKQFDTFSHHQALNMLNDIQVINRFIDKAHNRFYLRACTPKANQTFTFKKVVKNTNSLQTTKKACILQSEYPNKNQNQLKKILVDKIKANSVEELYGTMIYNSTILKNGKITDNETRSKIVGTVRIKGNPIFFNGDNFGEICAEVTTYITPKDIQKFTPKTIKFNDICMVDDKVSLNNLKQKVKNKAYKNIVTSYNLKLQNISANKAKSLIHKFIIKNEKFDVNTGAYCISGKATILPYELEMIDSKNIKEVNKNKIDTNNIAPGLVVTFYKANDIDMKKPIYQTYIDSLDLSYRSLPINDKIKEDTPYIIKIDGYAKSDKNKKIKANLYSDVYYAKLYINGKLYLKDTKPKNLITLKKGFNKVKLIFKTANRYDVRVVGLDEFYTNKLKEN